MISCRFPDDQMRMLQDALAIKDDTVSSFIRSAVNRAALDVVEQHMRDTDPGEWGEPLEPVKPRTKIRHIWTGDLAPLDAQSANGSTTTGNTVPVYVHLRNDMWAELRGGVMMTTDGRGTTLVKMRDGTWAEAA